MLPAPSHEHMPPPPLPTPSDFLRLSFSAPDCQLLATRHHHSRDERIAFTALTHEYTIDGRLTHGSVTGLVHRFVAPFVEDDVIARMATGGNWPRPGYIRLPPPLELTHLLGSLDSDESKQLRTCIQSALEDELQICATAQLCCARHPHTAEAIVSLLSMDSVEIKSKWKTQSRRGSC